MKQICKYIDSTTESYQLQITYSDPIICSLRKITSDSLLLLFPEIWANRKISLQVLWKLHRKCISIFHFIIIYFHIFSAMLSSYQYHRLPGDLPGTLTLGKLGAQVIHSSKFERSNYESSGQGSMLLMLPNSSQHKPFISVITLPELKCWDWNFSCPVSKRVSACCPVFSNNKVSRKYIICQSYYLLQIYYGSVNNFWQYDNLRQGSKILH